jgi:TetR/AcrR family transcriptional repressor of nem operon
MARPKTFDEDAILESALELFWKHGYDGVSISDLEAELGVGRQSLYNSFGDKRELFHRALALYTGRWGTMRDDSLIPELGLAGIRAYFSNLASFLGTSARGRGCFLMNTSIREAPHDPKIAADCRGTTNGFLHRFHASLAVARERGEVPRDLALDAASRALVAQMYGMGTLAAGGATEAELELSARWLIDRLS